MTEIVPAERSASQPNLADYAATPIRPGSMGKPLPGIDEAILRFVPRPDGARGSRGLAGDHDLSTGRKQ